MYPIKSTHWKSVSNPDCSHIEKGEKPKKQTYQTGMEFVKVDKSKRYIIQGNGHLRIIETGFIRYIRKNGKNTMKEYTAKEMKILKANPYTFKVKKNCILQQNSKKFSGLATR